MRLNIEMKSSDELASVPTNIIEKLSAADMEAYRNPVVYFRSAAERTGINELQQLFENDVSDGQIAHIRIEYDLVAEVNMWFSFTLVKRKCSPWYCAYRSFELPVGTPSSVLRVFEGFGGILSHADVPYGFLPPNRHFAARDGGLSSLVGQALTDCVFFFAFGNGDYIGFDREQGCVMYDHETPWIQQIPCEGFIEDYFRGLLKRRFVD